MSLAVLLSKEHNVKIIEINETKIKMINSGISPIKDSLISKYLGSSKINLSSSFLNTSIIENANIIIIATPTDFDETTNKFDTSTVDNSIDEIVKCKTEAMIVIKSTIPEGHTEYLQSKYKNHSIIFSPEFLREGKALYDNLYPSRIVIGSKCENARIFAEVLQKASLKDDVKVLFTSSREAEAIKLFSNTYLALRVAFFNELDTYAMSKDLNADSIISGLSSDPRIGDYYNNPSFGYGGYCLPKDTKQLLTNFDEIPQDLIKSVISSNAKRKVFISESIIKNNCKVVGFYRLAMKKDGDNFRSSSIIDVINLVNKSQCEILIYEPSIKDNLFDDIEVDNNLNSFKSKCDLIVANRFEDDLLDVRQKVFTRDIYKEN